MFLFLIVCVVLYALTIACEILFHQSLRFVSLFVCFMTHELCLVLNMVLINSYTFDDFLVMCSFLSSFPRVTLLLDAQIS